MSFKYKKLVILILPSLIVLGVYFLYSEKDKTPQTYKKDTTLASVTANSTETQDIRKDSDGDGLMDWEETLWKTDPNNPDSDGNGVPDGQQVRNAGVEKFQNEKTLADYMDPKADSLSNALNEKLMLEMFMKKGMSGKNLSQNDIEEIGSSIVSSLDHTASVLTPEDKYNETDILILKTSGKEDIKKYANTLGALIKKHFDPIPETEITILYNTLMQKNPEGIEKLKPLELAYGNTALEALKIPVPSELTQDHLNMINNFSHISEQLKNVQKVYSDPALAMVSLKFYFENGKLAVLALRNINTTLQNKEIVFNESEPGKLFETYEI